jgi:hypothetical protein
MLIDFIEVKNVFDNPDEIIEFAKRQEYLTKEKHDTLQKTFYSGLRTKSLSVINEPMYHSINSQIFTKCIEQLYPDSSNKILYGFAFETSTYFHLLTEDNQFEESWIHQDPNCVWAGVVYLNTNPKPNSGTIVYRNGEKVVIDNEFNKLILYSPTYDHASQGGFGTNPEDGRLTISFFVNAFQFKLKSIINEE